MLRVCCIKLAARGVHRVVHLRSRSSTKTNCSTIRHWRDCRHPIGSSRLLSPSAPLCWPVLAVRWTCRCVSRSRLPLPISSPATATASATSPRSRVVPLVEFYVAHGLAVLQPTHLSSCTFGIPADNSVDLFVDSCAINMVGLLDDPDD